MAHKGVVGTVALGLSLYAAHEKFKDWEVEHERKKRKQADQDRQDEYLRRLEEAERKKGGKNAAKMMAEIEDSFMMGKDFQTRVYSRLDEILYDLVVRVGEEGTPLRNRNIQQLSLPLLGNEYDKEDLMLAAAFALGDADIVDRVIKTFEKQKLGIGLKKFSFKSVRNIITVLESVEDPDISHKNLTMFISCAYSPEFRTEQPTLRVQNGDSCSQSLLRWGDTFNVHVTPYDLLNWKRPDFARGRMKFTFMSMVQLRVRQRAEGVEPSDEPEKVVLSNFHCPFEASMELDGRNGTMSTSFEDIRVIAPKSNRNMRAIDVDAIATVFAEKIAAGVARAAAMRLKHLLSLKVHEEGISHEHICVQSGNSSDLLRVLREQDMNLIAAHEAKVSATLLATLKHNMPPPDKKVVKTGESPNTQLDREISQFVTSYVKLVHLAYCEVPLLAGRPPSNFVPEYGVQGAALRNEDCFWEAKPLLIRARTRLLQKEEQERLVLSRALVVPGKLYSFLFVLLSWAFSSWLCTATTQKVLDSMFPLHSVWVLLAVSQVFTVFLLHSLVGIFKTKVFEQGDGTSWLVTVSYCTEYLQRRLAAKRGKPTPFDQEMQRLRGVCKAQYREWKLRIAKREFHAALKRKRITAKESVLLLTDFAENYYETELGEIVEGAIPAPLSEAEEFLKMKVEEKSAYDEIQLSPDDTLKNYLQNNNRSGRRLTIEALGELSEKVEECVLFSEGARVVVKLEEEDLEGVGTGSPTSACTDLAMVVRGGNQTGSVVFCTATLCFVHFDGGTTVIPVPIRRCSILDENPVPIVDDVSDDNDDEFEVESVGEESGVEDEDESVHIAAPQAQKRARTVEEALVDGGWEFERCKKHIKYSRRVKLVDGGWKKQNVTVSKTPSDRRAGRNALALLRRMDRDGDGEVEVVSEEARSTMCRVCHEMKRASDFSKSQLKKGVNAKCKDCVGKL